MALVVLDSHQAVFGGSLGGGGSPGKLRPGVLYQAIFNPIVTVIGIVSSAVRVAGVSAIVPNTDLDFTVSNHLATYTGAADIWVRIFANLSIVPVSGVKLAFTVLGINGTADFLSLSTNIVTDLEPEYLGIDYEIKLSNGDTVELMVGNNSDLTNFLVNGIRVGIRAM